MKLYIKNMVCIRCKMVVRSELEKLGIYRSIISLGEVKIKEELSIVQQEKLNIALKKSGFELIDRKKGRLIENIKEIVVQLVHYNDEQLKNNFHEYLSKKLHHKYTWLDNLFLEIQNTTIEKFFIAHKIERAKELLVYYKLNIIEIAYQLNYHSTAQLVGQFKEVTGFPPSHFQRISDIRQIVNENV
jgi:AraC-like DNA-binding protein